MHGMHIRSFIGAKNWINSFYNNVDTDHFGLVFNFFDKAIAAPVAQQEFIEQRPIHRKIV
jgi:hypothetical protein